MDSTDPKKLNDIKHIGPVVTEHTFKYKLSQEEEPVEVAAIILTKSGKLYITGMDNLLKTISLYSAGIQIAIQLLAERDVGTVSNIVVPNNIIYPKFPKEH